MRARTCTHTCAHVRAYVRGISVPVRKKVRGVQLEMNYGRDFSSSWVLRESHRCRETCRSVNRWAFRAGVTPARNHREIILRQSGEVAPTTAWFHVQKVAARVPRFIEPWYSGYCCYYYHHYYTTTTTTTTATITTIQERERAFAVLAIARSVKSAHFSTTLTNGLINLRVKRSCVRLKRYSRLTALRDGGEGEKKKEKMIPERRHFASVQRRSRNKNKRVRVIRGGKRGAGG